MILGTTSEIKKRKRKKFFAIWLFIFLFLNHTSALAQNVALDYGKEIIIDSDLDGLTDLGEKNIFKTDPQNPDFDGDGYLDGAEIIGGANPLNNLLPAAERVITSTSFKQDFKPSWGWYVTRSSALIGFMLLYFSVFSGLAIRIPGLRKIFASPLFCRSHCWLSLQALIFAALHAFSLLFDKFLNLGLKDIFIPFAFQPSSDLSRFGITSNLIAFGAIAFYLMLALVISSYLRKFIGQKIWRALHFTNIALYLLVAIHALMLGTDFKNSILRNIFLVLNGLLALLILLNYFFRLKDKFKQPSDEKDENKDLCETPFGEK